MEIHGRAEAGDGCALKEPAVTHFAIRAYSIHRGHLETIMERRPKKNVLFLCTGNYYRSRFAEILFNSVAGKMGLPWISSSRGLALERGVNNVGPMASLAVQLLETHGLGKSAETQRFPVQVTEQDFQGAAWIVALQKTEHEPLLQAGNLSWSKGSCSVFCKATIQAAP